MTDTQILDDSNPTEGEKVSEMGLTLLSRCDELWDLNILGDHISKGMKTEIQFAQEHEISIRHITTEELMSQEKWLTLGSLFDGIGGFPTMYKDIEPVWASKRFYPKSFLLK